MLWKLYLGLVAFLVGGSLVALVADGGHPIHPWMDYIAIPLSAVQVVGLYGYAFRRPIISERFWRLAVPVFVLNLVGSIVIGGVRFAATRGDIGVPAATILTSLVALPLFLPLLIGNRKYAFHSPAIWKGRSRDATNTY